MKDLLRLRQFVQCKTISSLKLLPEKKLEILPLVVLPMRLFTKSNLGGGGWYLVLRSLWLPLSLWSLGVFISRLEV